MVSTPINPITETMVSMMVQDFIVCLMLKLKYSLNSQKPLSFTCDSIKLPEPTANTIKLGSVLVAATTGAMMPAVVKPATVADPIAIRIIALMSHPNKSGGNCN